MDATIRRRLSTLEGHLKPVPQSNKAIEQMECRAEKPSKQFQIPYSLTADDLIQLRTNYVEDHTEFRESLYQWFGQRTNEFAIRSGTGDGTLEFIRQRSHKQATAILKQKFITV